MNVTKSIVADHKIWEKVEELADSKTTSVSAIVRQAIIEKMERDNECKLPKH